MIVAMPNLTPALPEIFILVMVSLILIIDLFLSTKNRFITYALTQITLLGAAWITVSTHGAAPQYTFSNMFVDDAMSDVLKLMSYISVSVVLVYSRAYISLRGMFRGEGKRPTFLSFFFGSGGVVSNRQRPRGDLLIQP